MHCRRYFALLLTALLLGGCSSTVNVDYEQSYNFAALKTYVLQEAPERIDDDPRLDTPMMQQRLIRAIRAELQQAGLREAKPGEVRVSYRLDIKQEIESDSSGVSVGLGTFSRNVGIGFGYGFPTSGVESYDRLVLTIDLDNRETGDLLWRGSDSRRLYAGSTPKSNTELVNELVEAILKKFPPR
ncbi:DUF4136 domain-containing protein [Thiohalophilus thiocyanatoxydans]|uniref:Uncharacterized protein DUF4136 n=1 Tax=Thiohalophilus thiocyanatoxydans TaxID=381308 RepID=A0A4R8ITZ9_9GAMM|nr:DUF4136 domain-containing protein [Thiohalophilus thiocyanatoxydans]TDY03904.1 uncharacterized protein DUF4136 [Thiohalophilus thiocyanatoxydans]